MLSTGSSIITMRQPQPQYHYIGDEVALCGTADFHFNRRGWIPQIQAGQRHTGFFVGSRREMNGFRWFLRLFYNVIAPHLVPRLLLPRYLLPSPSTHTRDECATHPPGCRSMEKSKDWERLGELSRMLQSFRRLYVHRKAEEGHPALLDWRRELLFFLKVYGITSLVLVLVLLYSFIRRCCLCEVL